jgi:hypothetical protein
MLGYLFALLLMVAMLCVGIGLPVVLMLPWERWLYDRREDGGRARARARSAAGPVALPVVKGRGVGRCAYCHDEVGVEDRTACAGCLAVHHADCWEDRCAACGARLVLGLVNTPRNRSRVSL